MTTTANYYHYYVNLCALQAFHAGLAEAFSQAGRHWGLRSWMIRPVARAAFVDM